MQKTAFAGRPYQNAWKIRWYAHQAICPGMEGTSESDGMRPAEKIKFGEITGSEENKGIIQGAEVKLDSESQNLAANPRFWYRCQTRNLKKCILGTFAKSCHPKSEHRLRIQNSWWHSEIGNFTKPPQKTGGMPDENEKSCSPWKGQIDCDETSRKNTVGQAI